MFPICEEAHIYWSQCRRSQAMCDKPSPGFQLWLSKTFALPPQKVKHFSSAPSSQLQALSHEIELLPKHMLPQSKELLTPTVGRIPQNRRWNWSCGSLLDLCSTWAEAHPWFLHLAKHFYRESWFEIKFKVQGHWSKCARCLESSLALWGPPKPHLLNRCLRGSQGGW